MSENWLADAVETERTKSSRSSLKTRLVGVTSVAILLAVSLIGLTSIKPSKVASTTSSSVTPQATEGAANTSVAPGGTTLPTGAVPASSQGVSTPLSTASLPVSSYYVPSISLPTSSGTVTVPSYTYTPPTTTQPNCGAFNSSYGSLLQQLTQAENGYNSLMQQSQSGSGGYGLSGAQLQAYYQQQEQPYINQISGLNGQISSLRAQYPSC
jgi:hypothetical protein